MNKGRPIQEREDGKNEARHGDLPDELEKLGAKVTVLPVDRFGMVDPDDVRRAITSRTILITVMHANNEVGTIEPIAEISAIAREAGISFHTDAAQTVGKIPADVEELGVDLLSVAGHKVYAPKGIGVLYIREGTKIEPFVHGAVRFSLGRTTTREELEEVLDRLRSNLSGDGMK